MEQELKKSLCVFCGSSLGNSPVYAEAAAALGSALAAAGWGLVTGGGDLGLMGAVAGAAEAGGGAVTGVIPAALYRVVGRTIGQTEVVETMHERKQRMYSLSSGFLALPGGLGTLDELFEVLTWQQLGIHSKPVAVLNVGGFFDPVLAMVESAKEKGFIRATENRLHVFSSVDEVVPGFERLVASKIEGNLTWVGKI